jgi:integrase
MPGPRLAERWINHAFALGRKLGLLTCTLRVRDHRLGESAPRQGFFERSQFESVLRHLTRRELHDGKSITVAADDLRLACTLAFTLGWRMQSEILTLQRRHVSLDAAGGMGTLALDASQTKNDDARVVVLTPTVRAALQAQLARLDAFQRRTGSVTPYLFVHTSGVLCGKRIKDFTRTWRTACKAAGVPAALRHDFRRTAVRGMVNAGVPERVAMEISGHKTRSVFDRYHIVSQADHVRAARLIAAAQETPRASVVQK